MNKIAILVCITVVVMAASPALPQPNSLPARAPSASDDPTTSGKKLAVEFAGVDLYNAIKSDVTHEVDKLMRERDTERWTYIGVALSLLAAIAGFLGFRRFSDLRQKIATDVKEEFRSGDLLRKLVEESVQVHVTADIEKRLSIVSKELAFYRLSNLASSLRTGTGFTNAARDAAMASLEELRNETKIIKRAEFADVLEKVIDAFAAADLDHQVDIIDDKLSEVTGEAPGIVQTLVQHYGMRVLGDVQPAQDTVERFHRYAEACKRHRIYELALPYLMVLEHHEKTSDWETRLKALIQDAGLLKDDEKETVEKLLRRNADPAAVAKKPTGQVLRFSQAFKVFVSEWWDKKP